MNHLQRRDVLLGGSAAAGMMLLDRLWIGLGAGAEERLIPWSDQPPPIPPPAQGVIKNLVAWEGLDTWITPNDKFFSIGHYEWPELAPADWRLEVMGQVGRPLTPDTRRPESPSAPSGDLHHRMLGEQRTAVFHQRHRQCRMGGHPVGRAAEAGADQGYRAREVVFFGADQGREVLRGGSPGEVKFTGTFARSMSLEDAMNPENILCYEMNGEALPAAHGAPVRLIAPGWFGVANVKWLRRIEVRDTRFMGRFMGRDYVTVREEQRDGETVVMETSVGRVLLKSAPARVTLSDGRYRIAGMAWGPEPIAAVEVKVDDGSWTKATLDGPDKSPFAWRFWHLDWPATSGEHTHHLSRDRRQRQCTTRDGRSDHRQQEDLLGKQRSNHSADPHRMTGVGSCALRSDSGR